MPKGVRKHHSTDTKVLVALEAIKEKKTTAQIASEYGIHAAQVSQWKSEFVQNAHIIFQSKKEQTKKEDNSPQLYEEIGRLKVELEWLKKKSAGVRR